MHIVGLIIRIFHHTRSPERQIQFLFPDFPSATIRNFNNNIIIIIIITIIRVLRNISWGIKAAGA